MKTTPNQPTPNQPTPNQIKVIDYFIEKLNEVKSLNLKSYQGDPAKHVKRINDGLKDGGVYYDANYAADSMGDIIITIINNP